MRSVWKISVLLLFLCISNAALSVERVSTHLVLALDCSESVSVPRWRAQLLGYSAALRTPEVVSAMAHTGVAITVVVWSGADEQVQALPWIRVHDEASALTLALAIERIPMVFKGYTNIGSGIDFSTRLITAADPENRTRRVIDISGDGQHRESAYPNAKKSVSLETARARALAAEITINGLPIEGDEYKISQYFETHVIAGEGAFIETVANPDDTPAFARAIKKKLLRELLASLQ